MDDESLALAALAYKSLSRSNSTRDEGRAMDADPIAHLLCTPEQTMTAFKSQFSAAVQEQLFILGNMDGEGTTTIPNPAPFESFLAEFAASSPPKRGAAMTSDANHEDDALDVIDLSEGGGSCAECHTGISSSMFLDPSTPHNRGGSSRKESLSPEEALERQTAVSEVMKRVAFDNFVCDEDNSDEDTEKGERASMHREEVPTGEEVPTVEETDDAGTEPAMKTDVAASDSDDDLLALPEGDTHVVEGPDDGPMCNMDSPERNAGSTAKLLKELHDVIDSCEDKVEAFALDDGYDYETNVLGTSRKPQNPFEVV